jgi:hypothetical protein
MLELSRRSAASLILAGGLVLTLIPVLANGQGRVNKPTQTTSPVQPPVATVAGETILTLVRTSLLTLNDAIQTGNFTVLRDVGAPGFRETYSAARLSQIFSDLAARNIDLAPVATLVPQLAETPSIDPTTNMLRIRGTFPGNPVQIDFELLFHPIAGRWRLFGITVQPKDGSAQTTSANAPKGGDAEPTTNTRN